MRTNEEILQGEPEDLFATSCYFNIAKYAVRVLGKEIKPFHKEWLDIWRMYDRVALAAPTGFGKTTIFGVVIPLWYAFFKPKSISLIMSKVIRTQASNTLEEIKTTIEENEFLKPLMPEGDIKSTWTKEKIITTNGSKILYSSYSVNVRGIHPDYLFADEVSTYGDHELFLRDVSTRVVSKRGKLMAVSTPLNTTDLLAKLMNTPGYFKKFYPAIVNRESIWPERFPLKILMEERSRSGISNFERNYMCNPKAEVARAMYPLVAIENCYDITKTLVQKPNPNSQVFIGVDLAISSGPESDFDSYIVVEKFGDIITILWGEVNRIPSKAAKLDRLKQLYALYNPMRIVIDESQIGSAIIQDLRSEGLPIQPQSFQSAARSKLLINLQDIIGDKRLVIPLNRDDEYTGAFTDRLTEELIGFEVEKDENTKKISYASKAAHDDIVMALAMAVSAALSQQNFEDYISGEVKVDNYTFNQFGVPDDKVYYQEADLQKWKDLNI